MLFDLRPKETLKDLYGRRAEYSELSRLVNSGSWVVVLGKRMTGKTSLIKTFAKENDGIYVNLLDAKGVEDLARKLLAESGYRLEEAGVNVEVLHVRWTKVAEDALSRVKDKVVVLDEIQQVSSPYLLKLLKSAWDTHRELRMVFSGSYVGILKRLVDPDPTSPLYGRSPAKVILKTFPTDLSKEFLRAGFREHRQISMNDVEIGEVVDRLNGYVGWLTYYGNFRCVRRLRHEEALKETIREGSKIIRAEINNFLKNRRRELYVKALRMMGMGTRWNQMKRELGVNSKVLGDILGTLTDLMMVEEKEGYYWIDDPMLREAVKLLK
jgi:hypothetical protein